MGPRKATPPERLLADVPPGRCVSGKAASTPRRGESLPPQSIGLASTATICRGTNVAVECDEFAGREDLRTVGCG